MTQENNPASGQSSERMNESSPGRRRRWPWVVGGLVVFGLLVITAGIVAVALLLSGSGGAASNSPDVYDEEYVSGDGAEKIVAVPVEGEISDADSTLGGVQPVTTPEGLDDALRQAAEDDSVVAVILEVNSPGGGVTASDEMHQSILDFKRESGKPVVVSMGSVAASGGYYISTAADEIVANETTLTGSLGVILPLTNFSKAADKYGITQDAITSGKFKDIGSPFKKLKPEEREILQGIVDQNYDEFVSVIVEGRGLPEKRVREIADGRIYSGEQAKELGLVDEFGGLEEAANSSRSLADVDEATVVRYTQTPAFSDLLRARLAPPAPDAVQIMEAVGLELSPEPQYLYRSGV